MQTVKIIIEDGRIEQFNEEVKNDLYHHTVQGQYNVTPLWLERFITQKLTTHKELILKMVREKMLKDPRLDALAIDNIEDDLDELGRIF